MTTRSIVEYAAFQLVWFVSAFGAARGLNGPGVGAALLLVAAHLYVSRSRVPEAIVVLVSAFVGFAAESLFVAVGVIRHAAVWSSSTLAPVWIVALWMAFATTLGATRRLFGENACLKAAGLGAIFGPAAYLAGDRLGALELSSPIWHGLMVTSAVWALAFPALIAVSARPRGCHEA